MLKSEEEIDLAKVVAKISKLIKQEAIDIPKVAVIPKREISSYAYKAFTLDVSQLNLQYAERDIVIQNLHTNEQTTLTTQVEISESLLENYIIHAIIDFDDTSYDEHADLIHAQIVEHFLDDVSEYET